jgi:hypothetical protein
LYFKNSGDRNTLSLIKEIHKRINDLEITHIVVPSTTGRTAIKFLKTFKHVPGVKIVCITSHTGYSQPGKNDLLEKNRRELEKHGIPVITATHSLSGVSRSISSKFGGITSIGIIAESLRLFGQGVKVAVEVSIMAADAGVIPVDREIIAVGGSDYGADTALVVKPANMNNFFDLEIREIICKVIYSKNLIDKHSVYKKMFDE